MTAQTAEKTSKRTKAPQADAEAIEPVEAPEEEHVKDIEAILPPAGEVTIQGVRCGVRRLKTREFFALMGIMTGGLGPMLGQFNFAEAEDAEEFGGMLMGAFLIALPQQTPQFMKFVQEIVEPKGDKHENREVHQYLDNPEIEDLLPIIDGIIEQEKDHLYELMGKARAYMSRWGKTLLNR